MTSIILSIFAAIKHYIEQKEDNDRDILFIFPYSL